MFLLYKPVNSILHASFLLFSLLIPASSAQSPTACDNTITVTHTATPTPLIFNITSTSPMNKGDWNYEDTSLITGTGLYMPWRGFMSDYLRTDRNSCVLVVQIPFTADSRVTKFLDFQNYWPRMPFFIFDPTLTSLLYTESVPWNSTGWDWPFPKNKAVQFKAPPSNEEFVRWMKGEEGAQGPDIVTSMSFYFNTNDTNPADGPRDSRWTWLENRLMHSFDLSQPPTNSTVLGARIGCT
ncbi:hypothetical protein QBC41DRAFT_55696 [Cercophora samala]|uniref:Uncharacterized protein n=1 Tax=Cercophora samala TaxID=330535 RepID=A0AA40D2V4_9PEZI|nr:hypothetical protein QBC41DRAFT_55696 [Cercophora samala]